MAYMLIGSERSPFVRICRMLMLHNEIEFNFRILNFIDNDQDAVALAKETPINKVPLLIDGDQKIFDSRVIINYLSKRHGLRPLSLEEENIISSVYSCLDSAVILFLMRRDGFDMEKKGYFLDRQKQRIPDNIEFLKPWARNLVSSNPDDWHYPAMALYSFLDWGERRARVLEVKSHPDLAAFMERFAGAPGVQETSF